MSDIKVVKTLTLSGIMNLKVVTMPPGIGLQTEDIDVTDFTNAARMEKVPRPQLEETELAIQAEYDGDNLAGAGDSGDLTIAVVDAAGSTINQSGITGYIKSAVPISVDIGGERRMLQDIVFVPDGSNLDVTTTTD